MAVTGVEVVCDGPVVTLRTGAPVPGSGRTTFQHQAEPKADCPLPGACNGTDIHLETELFT